MEAGGPKEEEPTARGRLGGSSTADGDEDRLLFRDAELSGAGGSAWMIGSDPEASWAKWDRSASRSWTA
ncbi:unnamed protein product [Peronospora effusa]|nr:unnamed protein product [Peronospora effusa]